MEKSALQIARAAYQPKLPKALLGPVVAKEGKPTQSVGNQEEIKALFPGVPVYVHFYSPRWICRMGNYRTYEEAHEVLDRVKRNGYQSAIIVKGKITVQYQ